MCHLNVKGEAICSVTHLIQLHSVGPCPVGGVAMEVEDDRLAVILDEALMVMVSARLQIIGGGQDMPHPHLDVLVDIDVEILSVGEVTTPMRIIKINNSRPSMRESCKLAKRKEKTYLTYGRNTMFF